MAELDSGTTIHALNDDVLTEILLLLPPEDLIRSKLACKRWLTHVSGDGFRRLYRRRHPPSFLIHADTDRDSDTDPAFFHFNPLITGDNFLPYNLLPFPNPKIMSSSNGLMILQSDLNYYLYNTFTKQSKQLILSTPNNHKVVGLHLAYDPLTSPHYKILCVHTRGITKDPKTTPSYYTELYDSVSCTWKLSESPHAGIKGMNFEHGVHCKNRIYFRTWYGTVFFFDIEAKAIRFLPQPRTPRTEHVGAVCHSNMLREYDGRVYYSAVVRDVKGQSLALWELQEDGVRFGVHWFLKYCHRVADLPRVKYYPGLPRDKYYPEYPVSQWKGTRLMGFIGGSDGEETITVVIVVEPGKIVSYSFVDKKYKVLVDYIPQKFRPQDVHHFCESL